MNRFLKIFSKENKEEKESAPVLTSFFETTVEQQLEFDKRQLAVSPSALKTPDETNIFKHNIPVVCQKFIAFFDTQLNVPGIFRTTGSLARVKTLKQALNHKYEIQLNEEYDIQTIASCFKLWLRELIDGIVPQSYFSDCMDAVNNKEAMKAAVKKLPKANFDTLEFIAIFLKKLSGNSEINKMTTSNIAIVFGPCLIRINARDDQLKDVMSETVKATEIIKLILDEINFIFDLPIDAFIPLAPLVDTTATPIQLKVEESKKETLDTVPTLSLSPATKMPENHALLPIPFNPDEDSVSSIVTDANSPLNKKQKLELNQIMASTIEDIISGSSSIQQRNKSITEGIVRSLSFEKSLTAEDALLLMPISKSASKVERRNVVKRAETEGSKSSINALPNAPSRPAPVPPHGVEHTPSVASSLFSIRERERSSSGKGSQKSEVSNLHRKLPTRAHSENRAKTKSERSLQESTVSSDTSRKQSINSLADSRISNKPMLIRAATTHGTNSAHTRKVSARSDPNMIQDDISRASTNSKNSLDAQIPSLNRKYSEKESSKDAGPVIMRRNTKRTGSSNLMKEIPMDPSATDSSSHATNPSTDGGIMIIPSSSTPAATAHNILEFILESDRIPLLTELSKADVHQVKTSFKALHDLVHANMATPTEMMSYKKLKRVIKSWQVASQTPQQWTNIQVVSEEKPRSRFHRPESDVHHLTSSLSSIDMLSMSISQSTTVPPSFRDDSAKQNFNELKTRKRILQQVLHTYQKTFEQEHGRPIKSGHDIEPMKKEYAEYKELKRELEAIRRSS